MMLAAAGDCALLNMVRELDSVFLNELVYLLYDRGGFEWFDDVVLCACFERFDDVSFFCFGGHDNDGHGFPVSRMLRSASIPDILGILLSIRTIS